VRRIVGTARRLDQPEDVARAVVPSTDTPSGVIAGQAVFERDGARVGSLRL
jgi:hypothetical protein